MTLEPAEKLYVCLYNDLYKWMNDEGHQHSDEMAIGAADWLEWLRPKLARLLKEGT